MTKQESAAVLTPSERRLARAGGAVSVRDFGGAEPAFVVLHGFPDNSRIYDHLIPLLVAGGRRTIALDFLGFGASDKPSGSQYSFAQQLGDLEEVVKALGLKQIVPVGHDAGGPTAVNFALKHPDRTAAVTLLNAFYGEAPGLRVPEIIELFASKGLSALSQAFLASPERFAWLLAFQQDQMQVGLAGVQKARYSDFLAPLIADNFRQLPSAGAAFAQMTYQLTDEVAANTARLLELRRSTVPLLLIWGKADPYLHVSVAEYIRAQVMNSSLHVLEAGHWPQIDDPEAVAQIMLANS